MRIALKKISNKGVFWGAHRRFRVLELLGSLLLRLRVDILNLGLSENHVGFGSRAFENIWLADNEENLMVLCVI